VAWPWEAGCQAPFAERSRRAEFDGLSVRFLDCAPAAGETIRLRKWKRYHVKDLDSAPATTLPGKDELLVARGVAGLAAGMRYRQLSELPDVRARTLQDLWLWQETLSSYFRRRLDRLGEQAYRTPAVSWGRYGL
jgi:hypothetical protein